MIPTRRDLHFKLRAGSVSNWHARGAYVTQFANALSLSFPAGERYFIHTVRNYRRDVADLQLQNAVTAFIGQEAMHSREHEAYNRLLADAGLPAEELEDLTADFLELLKRWLPPAAQLSVTIAQEHFTAIIADLLLNDARLLEGADPRLAALWRWHALEEIEHKAVAFDVYEAVMGRGFKAYGLRSAGLLLTTAGFFALILLYQRRLLDAASEGRSWRGLSRFIHFMTVSPGLLPRLTAPWLSYLKPGFHPWNHDNRQLLQQMDAVLEHAA